MNQTPLRKHLTSAQSLGKHLTSIGRRNFSNSLLQHRSADNDVASRNSLPALLTTRPVTFDYGASGYNSDLQRPLENVFQSGRILNLQFCLMEIRMALPKNKLGPKRKQLLENLQASERAASSDRE